MDHLSYSYTYHGVYSILDHQLNYKSWDAEKRLEFSIENLEALTKHISSKIQPETADVVHLHDWQFGRVAEEIRKSRDKAEDKTPKIIVTIHNGLYQGNLILTQRIAEILGLGDYENKRYSYLKTLIDNADEVVTVGKTYAEQFNTMFSGLCTKPIHAIPNGLDFKGTQLYELTKTNNLINLPGVVLKGKPEETTLAIGGRLTTEKGIEAILLALPKLSEMYQQVIIFGEFQNKGIEELVKTYSPNNIKILGKIPRNQVLDVLKNSDAFLAPSLHEPFGLLPLEAMAQGAIPIVSNVSGHNDNFVDIRDDSVEGNAIVMKEVDDKNALTMKPTELCTTIIKAGQDALNLINDRLGHAILIRNAADQIKSERWSIKEYVKKYEEIYSS